MNKWFFRVILPLWIALLVINLALPKKSFSESENRPLAVFPAFSTQTLFDGKFMQQVDEYVNDHFMYRDKWITMQSSLEYTLGKREINDVFICRNALMADLKIPNRLATNGNTEGIQAFCKKNNIDKSHAYFMLVPSASAILGDKLPPLAQTWDQANYIENVNSELDDVTTNINILNTLTENKENYIYYRTDHHWTSDGAFLAYNEFLKAKNLKAKDTSEVKISTISDSFVGTLSSKCEMPGIVPDTIKRYEIGDITGFTVFDGKKTAEYTSCYFDEFLNKKDKYSYFLGQNQPVVTIKTNSKTNKRLLMFKDSYSHTLAPMFAEEYSEITLVDLRYINQDIHECVDVSKYEDVLFIYSTDVFSHQKLLSKLM